MNPQVANEIAFWSHRAGALLAAAQVVTEYFGTEEEEELFRTNSAPLLYWLKILNEVGSGEVGADLTAGPPLAKFECSEELAQILNPLLLILIEWEPDFTTSAREKLQETERERILTAYGLFLGEVGRGFCWPIWRSYPSLAPEGWSG